MPTRQNKLLPLVDRILLWKRYIIETINDQLKNISQIEHYAKHSKHKVYQAEGMVIGALLTVWLHIVAGLTAYSRQEKKPSIKAERKLSNAISY
jgi:hypothetical protein